MKIINESLYDDLTDRLSANFSSKIRDSLNIYTDGFIISDLNIMFTELLEI